MIECSETDTENRLMDKGSEGGEKRGWDVWREKYGNLHYCT